MKEAGHGYHWTEEQYLTFERLSVDKHEYRGGEVVAVPPSSTNHVRLMGNVGVSLHEQLRNTSYEAMMGQMRVRVPDGSYYGYPDVLVVQSPICADACEDTILNPMSIIEIVSPESEAFDRIGKFDNYRQIPSLRDYILISQHRKRVEHFARQIDTSWLLAAGCCGDRK